ncbi:MULTISPECIES: serine hydrolase domain-containing protein [unclassified Microbacterium]|uniref:serine hydrolase domain-containing protein n=1 Tax=unclassified Microbacterium TaxID=2609290 RepID=UPI003015F8A1
MVNGAEGSAWSSLRARGDDLEEHVAGTPAGDDPTPLTREHLFDLASVSKIVTALAALTLVDEGRISLDEPVRSRVPVGRGPHAATITLRHLLTHTSGLPDTVTDWREGVVGEALLERCLDAPLTARPGAVHRYSCVGYIALGRLIEEVAGQSLDEAVAVRVAGPAGASTLRYGPVAADSAVATEYRPAGRLVRGSVHDELAAAVGMPVGNAGLFGTARDVFRIADVLRSGGRGPGTRVLTAETVRRAISPGVEAAGYRQGLGLRVGERSWMSSAHAVGHTGFTGTAFEVDPASDTIAVLLTNRVHPRRTSAEAITRARARFFACDGRGDDRDGGDRRSRA